MLYNSDRSFQFISLNHTIPFVLPPKDNSRNLIPFLAIGNDDLTDMSYIDAYKKVFNILKEIFQGKAGYASFIKRKVASKFHNFLENLYDDLIISKEKNFSDYIEQASIDIYDLVLGQERVVFSQIADNLIDFKNQNKLSNQNKIILNQIIEIIDSDNEKAKVFLFLMIGKVLEGSLSQARKSLGGYYAEQIIKVFLEKQQYQILTQDGSKTATNTDFVVIKNEHIHCIAVQLSTNDRMRLSTDEYQQDSTNYLISFNGCTVSTKGKSDISSQRMSTWIKDSIESGKAVPLYVGRDTFIQTIREQYEQEFLTAMNLISEQAIDLSASIEDIVKLSNHIFEQKFHGSQKELEELKISMYLALWVNKYTLSFEEFITKLDETD